MTPHLDFSDRSVTGAVKAFERIREEFPEAIIQVDNPMDERTGFFRLCGFDALRGRVSPDVLDADFDALEILSGGDVPAARSALACWFYLLNTGARIIATGGSGSRAVAGEEAGLARTFIYCPDSPGLGPAERVASAIRGLRKCPNAFVTNGPFVHATLDQAVIGSTQTIEGSQAQMQLQILAAPWVDVSRVRIYRNGEVCEEFAVEERGSVVRCDRTLEVEIDGDCWLVVVVEGDRPLLPAYCRSAPPPTSFAVTNPFWVDADGDGQVTIGR
jgi:hypothetical protein